MLLAEVTSAPVDIAAWLGSMAFLVILVNGVLKLTDRMKPKPEPSTTYATKPELAEVRTELKAVDMDVKSLRKEIVENGDRRRASIEGKVEAVSKEMTARFLELSVQMGALTQATKDQDKQLIVIAGRLNRRSDGGED